MNRIQVSKDKARKATFKMSLKTVKTTFDCSYYHITSDNNEIEIDSINIASHSKAIKWVKDKIRKYDSTC